MDKIVVACLLLFFFGSLLFMSFRLCGVTLFFCSFLSVYDSSNHFVIIVCAIVCCRAMLCVYWIYIKMWIHWPLYRRLIRWFFMVSFCSIIFGCCVFFSASNTDIHNARYNELWLYFTSFFLVHNSLFL